MYKCLSIGLDRSLCIGRQSITPFKLKLYFLPSKFKVDVKVFLMVYKCINNQTSDLIKLMLLRQNTFPDKKTRQDYDRTGLRIPPVENLRYKCRSFILYVPVFRNRLSRSGTKS